MQYNKLFVDFVVCFLSFHVLIFLNFLKFTSSETLGIKKEERIENYKEILQKITNYAQIMRTLYDYGRIMKNANYAQNYVIA